MIKAIYPAWSALRAFGKKLEVTANNVANVNTDGFKKSRSLLQEASSSGVTISINRIDTLSFPLPSDEGTNQTKESSNVEVGEERVDLLMTKHAYTANRKTLKAEDEILGTLFDVLNSRWGQACKHAFVMI